MVLVLWLGKSLELGVLSSYSNSLSQTASFVAWVCPIYSALQLDKATVGCRFDN